LKTGGAFITLEGTEGVGKSTSMSFVEKTISAAGYPTLATREPGGTPLGERIREWVLEGDHVSLAAETEALLMFAARAHHLDLVIRPALAAGQWVVCDRFTDATFAYQGGGRGVSLAWLETLKSAVHADLEPHLTLLLDAPVEVGFSRISDRDPDHFEREDAEFFGRVRETYLELARNHPDRVKLVDAAQDLEQVQAQLAGHLTDFFKRFRDGP